MNIHKHLWLVLVMAGGAFGALAEEQDEIIISEFSDVISPDIPESVMFAGQQVMFDRFDMYERLDRELTAMSYTHGSTLLLLKRANRYFPQIIPILRKHKVPEDLVYLACIESNLDIRAYSPAKAAGLWQFMPATAKQFGLEVNDYVDERYNTEKATEAACKYLKKAYAQYGNWESVCASYNGGMTRITTELDKQKVESSFDLHLTTETTRYPYRIMAAKLILEDPTAYGFFLRADQLYQPIECDNITVTGSIEDLPQWAIKHGITYALLRELNPWLRAKSLPNKTGKKYIIKVPKKRELHRSTQSQHIYNQSWVGIRD